MKMLWVIFVFQCVFQFFCWAASADVYNRQYLPLGERQAFIANSGVAHSADGGAGYYNPAGLTELNRNQVSLTANTYFIYDLGFDSLVSLNGENIPYGASGFNMIPMAANAAWVKGDWKFGLSVMIPDSLQVQNRAPMTTSITEGQLLQSLLEQDLWGGLSLAKKIDERWSLGITAWAIQHSAVQTLSMRILVPASANTVITSSTRQSLNVVVGSVTAGIGYQASPTTRFGLRIQSPSFRLLGKADYYSGKDDVSAGVLTSTVDDRKNLKGYYQLPLDLTFGVAQILGDVELLFDLSLQLPVAYAEIPALSTENSFDTKTTARGSFGVDWRMSKDWALRSGLSYNPSSLRKLEPGSNDSRVDLWGGTLGLLWRAGQIETSGGLFMVKGTGKSAPINGTGFSDARITGYGAVLASSYLF